MEVHLRGDDTATFTRRRPQLLVAEKQLPGIEKVCFLGLFCLFLRRSSGLTKKSEHPKWESFRNRVWVVLQATG